MNHHIRIAEAFARLLDSQFKLGKFKFGLDPILGIIPGIGDILPLILSLYIVWVAKKVQVPPEHIKTMYRNIVFDTVLGVIPIVGDLSDFVYKANTKNIELLKKHARNYVEGEVT